MFHSKKAQVDFKRVTQKFLDAKRESRQRANALRTLLGKLNPSQQFLWSSGL